MKIALDDGEWVELNHAVYGDRVEITVGRGQNFEITINDDSEPAVAVSP